MNRNLALLALAGALSVAAPSWAGPLRNQYGPYELEVLVDGTPAPTFQHNGETYVMGQHGDRYTLRVWNRSDRRVEAVLSVDGRDVVDGRPGDFRSKRGYVVPAWGHVDIDGWRLSQGQAAAFRFSTVSGSYAARMGSARDVGVIGLAVFPEREVRYVPPRPVYVPRPQHYNDDYAPGSARSEAAPAPPAAKSAPAQGGAVAPSTPSAEADGYADRERASRRKDRPGLGTSFGEAVDAPVYEVEFVRQSAAHPAVMLGLRYNDHDGLLAMGVDVDGRRNWDEVYTRRTADPFPASHPYAAPPPGWNGY